MNHKLHVPPRGDEEPTAILVYGEDRFEIGYTLMHWLTGVLAMGAAQSGVAPQILGNARAAFDFVDRAMCWDANPPEQTGEHADMLRRVGYTLTRPTFKLPNPEVTEYEAGHTPKPFKQHAALPSDAAQAPLTDQRVRAVMDVMRTKFDVSLTPWIVREVLQAGCAAPVAPAAAVPTGDTAHLLASPANAERLRQSVAEFKAAQPDSTAADALREFRDRAPGFNCEGYQLLPRSMFRPVGGFVAWGSSGDKHAVLVCDLFGERHLTIVPTTEQRMPDERAALDEAVRVFEQAAFRQTYRMRDGVAAVLKFATERATAPQATQEANNA